MPPEPDIRGPAEFAAAASVSRETMARLERYASLLAEWNAKHNLVSRRSMEDLWGRHFWDSAQLAALIPPAAESLIDLGSGAGFPGLVIAELLRERTPPLRTVLVEATAKKCRFLETVAGELGLALEVRCSRIEDLRPAPFDVITARACAPLPILLAYAQRFWGRSTRALFHKGQNLGAELTETTKSWRIESEQHPSRSDPSGIILEIRELQRVARRSNPA
jgi:16S rRNA (guanine527-N7)-methyltransferase